MAVSCTRRSGKPNCITARWSVSVMNELRPYLAGDPAAEEMLALDMTELDEVYKVS
jgi:hypothetical protein